MISAFGRSHGFPNLMSLMAEQLFKLASIASWDLKDDTTLLNLYNPRDASSLRKHGTTPIRIDNEDIASLLSGIHTAASVEVVSFARKMDIDLSLLAKVVKDAAGANNAFQRMFQRINTDLADEKDAIAHLEVQSEQLVSLRCPLTHHDC